MLNKGLNKLAVNMGPFLQNQVRARPVTKRLPLQSGRYGQRGRKAVVPLHKDSLA